MEYIKIMQIDSNVPHNIHSLVSKHMDIEKDELLSSSRKRLIGEARAIIAYQAIHEMGYKGTEVSKVLGIRGSSVSQCVERGKKLLAAGLT